MTFGTVLRQSNMAFCSLKYTYVGKKIRGKTVRIWIKNTAVFLANLQICDLRTETSRKGNLWICGLIITNLQTGTPQKFADLRLLNEPKNLWNCDLQTNQKICVPTFGCNNTDWRQALKNRAIPFNLANGGHWFLLNVWNKAIAVLPPEIVGLNNHHSTVIYIPRVSIRRVGSPKRSS